MKKKEMWTEQKLAFLTWGEKQIEIRSLMKKGQLDESTASSMSEQVSQEFLATEREISSRSTL